jgi:hypothetical protein
VANPLKCANQQLTWDGLRLVRTDYCQADSVTTREVRRCGQPARVTPFCQEHADNFDRFTAWLTEQVTAATRRRERRYSYGQPQ